MAAATVVRMAAAKAVQTVYLTVVWRAASRVLHWAETKVGTMGDERAVKMGVLSAVSTVERKASSLAASSADLMADKWVANTVSRLVEH